MAKMKRTMLTMTCLTALLVSLLSLCTACRSNVEEPKATEVLQTNAQGYSLAPEFELVDQYGNAHKLSDYRGKVVYLTFWATWCEFSSLELADVEQLYQESVKKPGDVAVLGVVFPFERSAESETTDEISEKTVDEIKVFLNENKVTFPVLMDVDGTTFTEYAITGLPTTFLIDREGFFYGYIPASIDKELMDYFIKQALQEGGKQN